MKSGSQLAAIVLAAGASRRFGSAKQLHRVGGRSLVGRAADAVCEAGFHPAIVVVGSSGEDVARELHGSECDVIVNVRWEEGMASSIRAGVERVRQIAPGTRGVLIALADQTDVSREILESLADRFLVGAEPAVACRYDGVLGPPAIFAVSLFGHLEALTGDEGARSLLRSGAIPVGVVDFPEGARDIDTPDAV